MRRPRLQASVGLGLARVGTQVAARVTLGDAEHCVRNIIAIGGDDNQTLGGQLLPAFTMKHNNGLPTVVTAAAVGTGPTAP